MKTQTIPSLAPQAPSRDRRMALALGLLVTGVTLGACDTRTVVALTIVARPAAFELPLERLPNTLDLLVRSAGVIDGCKTYSLIPPDGGARRFEVGDGGTREVRLLYYPNVEEGTLALNVAVYAPDSAQRAGARGQATVELLAHRSAYAQIDLSGALEVSTLCRDLRPDLKMENDLSPPPDLTTIQDLAPTDMAIDKQDQTTTTDLLVEVPDATTPPRDLSVTDADASTGDLAIPDASIPNDLAATDADGKFDDTVDLNAPPDIGPPSGSCDDNNPCTYDVVVPTGDGGYTCMNPQSLQSGVVCRPAQGSCDIEELCDGKSPTCPPDVRQRPGSVCREETSPCDVAEVCDGNSPYCPPDAPAPACQELLIDGSFDLNLGAWELTPPQSRLTNNLVPCGRLSPPNHNILCGGPGCDAMTSQYVVLPSTKPAQLSFSLNTFSLNLPPTQTEDDFFVEVASTQGIATIARFNSAVLPRGYRRYGPIDLSAYKGSAVTLRFKAQTLNYATTFCLDDVSVLY